MKLAIYDTEHFETVDSLLGIWNTGYNQIHLFITPEVEKPLREMIGKNDHDLVWIVKRENNLSYLRKMKHYLVNNKIELFIINTVTYHHLLLAWVCKSLSIPIILTVHDANTTFNPRIQFTSRSLLRYFGRKKLIQNVSAFATLFSTTKEYIQLKFINTKPVYIFPGSLFNQHKLKPTTDILKIVVPGTIDENRRDYENVTELIKILKNREIEIVLLGASKTNAGKELIKKLNQFASDTITIITFSETFVSPLIYDKHLAEADFVLVPLIKTIATNENTIENYGVTKASGSFFDAVKFGKCIFVPAYIQIPAEFHDQCHTYNSIKEIAEILETHPMFINELKYKAWKNSFNFSAKAVREKLPFFNNLNKVPHEESDAS